METLDKHEFIVGGVAVAKFEEIASSVYQLDMLSHKIKDSRELSFDNSVEAIIINTEAVIGYSPTTEDAMMYNVPISKEHRFKINNNIIARLDTGGIKAVLDVQSPQLTVAVSLIDPLLDGVIRSVQNGGVSDVKVGTCGGILNLTDLLGGGGGGTPSSIVDSNSSLTISDTEPQLRLSLNAIQDWLWNEDALFIQSNSVNYSTEIFRNTGVGVNGQIIDTLFHKGNNTTSVKSNYVTEYSTIKNAANGAEDGQYNRAVLTKGSDKNAYVLEGGAGLINTNILHTLLGSMILKSDQDGDEALLRLERNDTTPSDDNEIGTIQFRGENSAGSVVQYGSLTVESADVSNLSENGRFAVDLINGALIERMIVADSLTNEIKLSPTSTFDYLFKTTGLTLPSDLIFDSNPANIVVANGAELIITEGGQPRITVNDNVILNADTDVTLAPDVDVNIQPAGDVILNPIGDIKIFDDLDMNGVSTIDFGTSSSAPVGSPIGAIQIKVNGTLRKINFYAV